MFKNLASAAKSGLKGWCGLTIATCMHCFIVSENGSEKSFTLRLGLFCQMHNLFYNNRSANDFIN